MTAINQQIERHHRLIIASLGGLILFFLASCTFHDALPICHYLFGCDHGFHSAG
jgi:hypothetical protein